MQLTSVDLFNAAVMFENRAKAFYASSAELFKGDKHNLLVNLSKMEAGHAKYFEKLLKETEQQNLSDKPTKETKPFLEALTNDRLITQNLVITPDDSYKSILEKAILLEKNSIAFYSYIKPIVLNLHKDYDIDFLINEEREHFNTLVAALASLTC